MLLVIRPPAAQAQSTHYSLAGAFTGSNSGNLPLVSAVSPVLGTGDFSLQFSIDAGATGSPFFSGGTLYRPFSNTSMSFGGFFGATAGCVSPSEFICTVQVKDGTGLNGTEPDQYMLLSDVARSSAFNDAVGEARPLDFQFILGLFDFTGTPLSNESVDLDLTQQNASDFVGSFTVFAPRQNGFDRADFGVQLSSITVQQTVPEPAPYVLLLPGLVGVAVLAMRRRTVSAQVPSASS